MIMQNHNVHLVVIVNVNVMSNKDLIFVSIILFWLTSSLILSFYLGIDYATINNIFWVVGLSVLVSFKLNNKKFGLWLEKPFRKK